MRVAENCNGSFYIGKVGENDTMQVPFHIGRWLKEYPDCSIHLAFKRPNSGDYYDVQNVEIVDGTLLWTVSSTDVEVCGDGKCELQMVRNGQVEKSKFYTISIGESAVMGQYPSDPVKEWFLRVVELEEDAIEAKNVVTTMSVDAATLESDEEATAVYDRENNVIHFGIPEGQQGRDGDDAPQIDDTQASAEHPWSGSKINSELNDVKDAIERLPQDVTVNGTSIVGEDGVAVLPLARASNVFGLVNLSTQNASGMYVPYDGAYIRLASADATRLANRTTETSYNLPVLLKNLNPSIVAALTDDNHITLTSAQQATARSVIFTAPTTITIAAASWSFQSVTVSVTGVTATGTIMLTPSTKADSDTIGSCGIWCTAQADGALTFTCTSTPTSAVSYNLMLF